MFQEILKFNKEGIAEEFGDVLHHFQIWFYWRFGLDQEVWKITSGVVEKFKRRREVWKKIYKSVSLDENISNYAGNYNRLEKVIRQLSDFGISEEKAKEVFNKIVLNK